MSPVIRSFSCWSLFVCEVSFGWRGSSGVFLLCWGLSDCGVLVCDSVLLTSFAMVGRIGSSCLSRVPVRFA